MRTELYRVAGDPLARQTLDVLATLKSLGRARDGERRIEQVSLEAVKLDVDTSVGEYPEVRLRVCADLSEIQDIDIKTGEVVTPREERQTVQYATVWFYEKAWHVIELESRDGEEEQC